MKGLKYYLVILSCIMLFNVSSHAASLLIKCKLPGASVTVDSLDHGLTNEKGLVYIKDISPGKHRVTVVKEGFDAFSKDIDVDRQLTTVINVSLTIGDKEPPEILILSPGSSRGMKPVVSEDMIEIIGLVSDESDIASVIVNGKVAQLSLPADDEKVRLPGETVMKFTASVSLSDGDNSVTIQAIDAFDNSAVFEHVINKKKDSPVANLNMNFHALIIGIDNYSNWPDLYNPVNDAKALASELEDNYGFNTKVMLNSKKSEVLTGIRSFSRVEFSENSELLIILAGHGHFDDFAKTGYFVPADGKSQSDDPNFESYINYPELQNIITNIKCKHILLVLDACFGGTFNMQIAMRGGENTSRELTKEEFIARRLKFQTRLMLSSGGKEYVPDGRPGGHSPFTRKLLEGLRSYGGSDGILTIEELKGNYMDRIDPQPYLVEFQYGNEPGSSFLFIAQ